MLDGCQLPRGAAGVRSRWDRGCRRGWRPAGNVVPDGRADRQPPVRARPQPPRRPEHVRSVLAHPRRATTSRSSTARRSGAVVDHPLLAALIERREPRGAGQAGLDRRGALRRARRPGRQLRARRRHPRPHRRRARRAGADRGAFAALDELLRTASDRARSTVGSSPERRVGASPVLRRLIGCSEAAQDRDDLAEHRDVVGSNSIGDEPGVRRAAA